MSGLKVLTQLRLDTLFGRRGPLSKVPSVAFRNATNDKDVAYRYAQEICNRCPSLRYLMIPISLEDFAWETITVGDGIRGQRFRQLNYREIRAIELFSDNFDSLERPAGLPLEDLGDKPRQYLYLRWVAYDERDGMVFHHELEMGSTDSEMDSEMDSDSS